MDEGLRSELSKQGVFVTSLQELYNWCRIPSEQLVDHPKLRIPFRLCRDSAEMGGIMARATDIARIEEAT